MRNLINIESFLQHEMLNNKYWQLFLQHEIFSNKYWQIFSNRSWVISPSYHHVRGSLWNNIITVTFWKDSLYFTCLMTLNLSPVSWLPIFHPSHDHNVLRPSQCSWNHAFQYPSFFSTVLFLMAVISLASHILRFFSNYLSSLQQTFKLLG